MKSPEYNLRVNSQLVNYLKLAGVEPSDVVGFLGEQMVGMMTTPSNFPKGRKRPKRRFGPKSPLSEPMNKDDLEIQENDMWIMRGFYPGTPIMFKLTMIHYVDTYIREIHTNRGTQPSPEEFQFLGRASLIVPGDKDKNYSFHSSKVEEFLLNKTLETSIFGDTTTEPLLKDKFIAPRTMSPQGIKLKKRKRNK